MNPCRTVVTFLCVCFPLLAGAQSSEKLTVTTWGGAYEHAQMEAFIEPFMKATGVSVNLKEYDGGLEFLYRQKYIKPDAWKDAWDVLDMAESDTRAACDEQLLSPFDATTLPPAPDGTAADQDFLEDSFLECGVIHLAFSTVLAFNDQSFPGEKPTTVADFFDIEKFPGKRGLKYEPRAVLEWALMSYGVPKRQIYDLLSTKRGMKLVGRRMDSIREHIVWWEKGEDPVDLLVSGEVAMSSGYNGRFFDARIRRSLPISVVQDGQFVESSAWGISANSPNQEIAKKFIEFATRTESMAAISKWMPYGPTRNSAFKRIGLHAELNVSMYSHMPTAPANMRTSIRADSVWYAETEAFRNNWFKQWLKKSQ